MAIRGTTQLVGILGWPVAHSLSPPMHAAAFEALGLDWAYVPLPTRPDKIGESVRGLAAAGFRGFNCTIPHKEAVLSHLDTVMPEARAIGAVNTVVVEDGLLVGHNTDVDGFVVPVERAGIDVAGKHVVILGAGGAARALVAGALRLRAARVTVANRTVAKADRLIADLAPLAGNAQVASAPLSETLVETMADAVLIANATSVGMESAEDCPITPAWMPRGAAVFESIYTHAETALMKAASTGGGVAIHGLEMLLHQGVRAFELWTGQTPDAEIMRRALEEARSH